ncbi:Acyl-CoA synthetase (AMP-forming)/AMP-acid ligase II [Amycolatopsis pretoriensis]|uniref:Acyl-CoA synthetase (AMP-forming)/AMP-acid ligase II n=1 Tax=Amycolatopsis pretoriensis TaxID=218821 RepID=A0A1H5RIC9_9PSEU|nr:AMP-binding protein [Amycolatopsis pretoriensis]SEF38096.1 Acyl-CoA synthetase (AMP-forming)/AMP-acid ligase II [Amycolatopsis pretoriensis]
MVETEVMVDSAQSSVSWRDETASSNTMADLVSVMAGRTEGSVVFPEIGTRMSHRELAGRAYGVAKVLTDVRVPAGDRRDHGGRVGILADNSPEFVHGLLGAFAAGLTAVPLAPPGLSSEPSVFLDRLVRVSRKAGVRSVLVGPPFDGGIEALRGAGPELDFFALSECGSAAPPTVRPPIESGDLAVVQFSSGSTSEPKGVMIEHGALLASIRGTASRSAVLSTDASLLWVPFFHDFGLVTLLTHLLTRSDLHVVKPATFVRKTAETVRYLARERISSFTGPNFSYERILKAAADGELQGIDLSSWRTAVNAGEPVQARTVRRFLGLLGPLGVGPSVMNPGYGMAEFCVGISYQAAGHVARIVNVTRASLDDGRQIEMTEAGSAGSMPVVSQGPAFPDVQLRIRSADGIVLNDGYFGEIEARGPNMLRGYLDDAEATRTAFDDGWFRTGDTGFLLDDELYVIGRKKDMIICAGRNFHAQDVEAVVGGVEGIYQRHVVAVADQEKESMVVIAETTLADRAGLAGRIRARVAGELGLAGVEVRLVERGWLPRTTSGKWQRTEVGRRLFETG